MKQYKKGSPENRGALARLPCFKETDGAYIMPMPPIPPMPPMSGSRAATAALLLGLVGDAAFRGKQQTGDGSRILQAERVTLVGSTTPAESRSSYLSVATL